LISTSLLRSGFVRMSVSHFFKISLAECSALTLLPGFFGTRRSWAAADSRTQGPKEALTMTFGHEHFGDLDLGDARRSQRLPELVDLMCQHPGGTLPDKLSEPRD